ncbi:MAG: penicillin-binding transpeptidase domain-containing protein [Treponema sp.]|nr:penicillin-binding transpeptidase domain-containing protein [Treponema sp.]
MSEEGNRLAGKNRFLIFAVVISLAALGLILRFGYLMLFPRQLPRQVGTERLAGRGPILDRNGRLLALETRLGNVTLWRPDITDIDELSRLLAPLLEQTPTEMTSRINGSQSDFLYLSRQVSDPVIRMIEAGIRDGRFRGVNIEPVIGRIYPERNLASQVIGFIGDEGTGLAGMEFAFDRELRGEQGSQGRGSQIFLTIDVNIQYILESIATRVMNETGAESIIFMAMDPRTGDILGSVSLPGYDPNTVRLSNEFSRMDRPAILAFEPGSTFKVFSLAAMHDAGIINPNTTFFCPGYYERVTPRGERIIINCLGSHGQVNARDVIVFSCNAGAAYAADQISSDLFYEYLRSFGFGSRTGAGNPGETAGLVRTTDRWSDRSRPTIAMGQEIAVSGLQMLQAISAIANDGILVPPRIIDRIVSPDGRIQRDFESGQARRILSVDAARAMRDYMIDATSNVGTGWRAFVEDLPLGIKTGTAQMIDPRSGAYSNTDFIASAIALLPADNPSLALYLAVFKPQGEIYGGRIAAPPIREAAEALVNYLGIPRGRNPLLVHPGAVSIPILPYPAVNEVVPDFTGVAKRLLLPLLLRDDLRFHVIGDGWVVRQSPPPGTRLLPDTLIVLELE